MNEDTETKVWSYEADPETCYQETYRLIANRRVLVEWEGKEAGKYADIAYIRATGLDEADARFLCEAANLVLRAAEQVER